MKSQKLLVIVAIVCLLGTSGAAYAVDCSDGVIFKMAVDNITIPAGQDCTIYETTVAGDITATGSTLINIFHSIVGGGISITKEKDGTGAVTITNNEVYGGDLLVQGYESAAVLGNKVGVLGVFTYDLGVDDNAEAWVINNRASGSIFCTENKSGGSAANIAVDRIVCPPIFIDPN